MLQTQSLAEFESLKKSLRRLQIQASKARDRKTLTGTATELQAAAESLSKLHQSLIDERSKLALSLDLAEEDKVRYQNLFDLAPDGYLVTDRRSVVSEANHAAAALLTAPGESLIGKPLAAFVFKDNLKPFLARTVRVVHRGGVEQFETRLRAAQYRTVDALVTVTGTGNGAALRWLIRDITERKQIEQKMRSSERLATMGTTALLLARELSNPLNSIFTTVQRLQRHADNSPPLRAAAEELAAQTSHLRGLLEKFLSFSRPVVVHPASDDLTGLLEEILDVLSETYGQHGIEIRGVLPDNLAVKMDYPRLKQALMNICINGIEAMPKGGRLTVQALDSNHRAVVQITDTGIGVGKNIDVFDLFTTTKFQAMGMGLPIARQIILEHGGTISFSSNPGDTVFRVEFPTGQ